MTDQILAVEPSVQRFYARDPQADHTTLMGILQSQRSTKPVPVQSEEDALLNDVGLLQQHYRLTTTALQQLCSVLIPGLSNVIANVSGLKPRSGQYSQEQHSYPKAIELLNWAVRFRFDLLENCSLIIDERHKQVEGVVGQRYRFLSNWEMLHKVEKFLRKHMPTMEFCEAALAGRRLLLRYKEPEWAFAVATASGTREPFYVGVHFSNSELGDCCVKGTVVLYRQWSKTAAILPFDEATKLVHSQGEKFNTKFRTVLQTVRDRLDSVRQMEQVMTRLADKRLGLKTMPEECQERIGQIVQALVKAGLQRSLAYDSVTRAMLHGSYKADVIKTGRGQSLEMLSPATLSLFTRRSVFDLFNGMTYLASQCEPARQEFVEQRAFELLTGDILID